MDFDDLELDFDPIAGFYKTKLDTWRSTKDDLEATKEKLKELVLKLKSGNYVQSEEGNVNISNAWKRICNGKCVFGLDVKNLSEGALTDITVVLHWTPEIRRNYSSSVYAGSKVTNEIERSALLIVSVDEPKFARYSRYDCRGILVFKRKGVDGQINLPGFAIDVKDYTSRIDVKTVDLANGDVNALLASLSTLSEITVHADLADDNLESKLIVDSMLRLIEFGADKYFLADDIGDTVNGSIIRYRRSGDGYDITIFFRDTGNLEHLLHHLHSTITPSINILPLRPDSDARTGDSLSKKIIGTEAITRKFGECLREQINIASTFQRNFVDASCHDPNADVTDIYRKARTKLIERELATDLLYERLESPK
ncbi:PREDICTED: uncharacterized protein LOC108567938 [Nicrophorus vespilloides]|uniref:Uncharacterized protein LOC108567938 n=1 Tax=Nicrophorus vespilloides TaxID=110193 RepID=A0ABM1NBP2_NICVS|nr:PREDICTED: uncharacterized protein LOC108567938 [Nicrophorus vespilloides]XP_017784242.1 PREDICTED: uncharacterized protein LOC108567938 [Nicrophorus vespilloides]